ncbi:hypothetical protein IE53DRAFT_188207 [Violaceomyces palustris]|uniref:Uncharacterized protein n=1 Tax=Violaceomyces palustris TaxID=1673888 RepID=A0ACD0NRY5_9BASI|nr:hypothetical protein IE53DRAFT_188207 [Violaceomyces palustris]
MVELPKPRALRERRMRKAKCLSSLGLKKARLLKDDEFAMLIRWLYLTRTTGLGGRGEGMKVRLGNRNRNSDKRSLVKKKEKKRITETYQRGEGGGGGGRGDGGRRKKSKGETLFFEKEKERESPSEWLNRKWVISPSSLKIAGSDFFFFLSAVFEVNQNQRSDHLWDRKASFPLG